MVYEVTQTTTFAAWRKGLTDLRAKVAIQRRMERAMAGNFGDHKSVGGGVSEMRIDVGAGYRLYYTIRQSRVVVLLVGGNKSSQKADIKTAQAMANEV